MPHDAALDLAENPRAAALADAVALRARFAEVFTGTRDGAGTGFILAQLGDALRTGTLLWVQDRIALRDSGRPYPHWRRTAHKGGLIHVVAPDSARALWAMEEGLRCPELSAVIGEVAGNPRALDFTATRRLAVAAERFGIPAFLLRTNSHPDLSGARMRWRVASRPSQAHPLDADAPGAPVWSLDLFPARGAPPGHWVASYDRATDRLDLVSSAGNPALGESEPATG